MTSSSAPVRVTDPAGLLAGLPYLVGFPPVGSLVVVVVDDTTSRVRLTLRADLPPGDAVVPAAIDAVVSPVARQRGVRVHLVVCPRPGGPATPAGRPASHDDLAIGLLEGFEAAGVPVTDVLVTAEGRWWSLLCHDPSCCPAEGRVLDTPAAWAVRAEMVAAGRAPLASREAVVELVAAEAGPRTRAVERAMARLRRRGLPADPQLVLDVLERGRGAASMAPRHLAAALLALEHVGVRDLVLALLVDPEGTPEGARRDIAALTSVVQCAPRGAVAPPATVLACLAYACGQGALAWAAYDRAVDDDPGYSLAGLLAEAMTSGLPPEVLAEAFTSWLPR